MKNYLYKIGTAVLFSSSLLFVGCDPEFEEDEVTFSQGENLNLTKYIAVGNSLTAGFQDNGLYREGQLSSYPKIMSDQFALVGGGDFIQPLFTEAQRNGSGYLELIEFTPTNPPSPITATVTTNRAIVGLGKDNNTPLFARYADLDKIQNFGVPGIKLLDIKTPGYGLDNPLGFNPYFERILPAALPQGAQTYLQRVSGSQHTFFSAWLGNNDVLGYATAGGFSGSISPTATFSSLYGELITAMTANGAEGIVATIPDVRSVPFFTTVGPTAKQLLTAVNVPAFYALTKNGATRKLIMRDAIKDAQGGDVLLTLTSSAYLPLFGTVTGKYWRDLAASQNPSNPTAALSQYLAVFDIDTLQTFGTERNPVPSALVLDTDEQNEINTATVAYNTAIKAQASTKNLAVFDAYEFFNGLQNGFNLSGVSYSPAFITGNLFSLDGVHPTPRGYAIIANEMIKEINAKYGSKVPTTDVTKFRAVVLP